MEHNDLGKGGNVRNSWHAIIFGKGGYVRNSWCAIIFGEGISSTIT